MHRYVEAGQRKPLIPFDSFGSDIQPRDVEAVHTLRLRDRLELENGARRSAFGVANFGTADQDTFKANQLVRCLPEDEELEVSAVRVN